GVIERGKLSSHTKHSIGAGSTAPHDNPRSCTNRSPILNAVTPSSSAINRVITSVISRRVHAGACPFTALGHRIARNRAVPPMLSTSIGQDPHRLTLGHFGRPTACPTSCHCRC